jgi:predicted nucleotidyltransferase
VEGPGLLSDKEIAFLKALSDEGVEFIVVGLAAAALQGAPAVTQDVDLWFADLGGERFLNALAKVGAFYVRPSIQDPPLLGGAGTDLFDIVTTMHGLGSFEEEYERVITVDLGGVRVPVLPLSRIIVSKEATGLAKDKAILPALRDALKTLRELHD